MRALAIALPIAGALAIAGAVLGLGAYMGLPPDPAPQATASVEAEKIEPPVRPEDPARQRSVRSVSPEVVAQPQIAPEDLQRVEARPMLSRFSQPLPRRARNQGRIFRPVISEAGRVTGSGLSVTIAGIEVTPADENCVDASGRSWACGIRARTAFRAFVRGRALACDLPEELTETHYTAACSLGKQDVGAWLVEQGWARARPGGSYRQAGDAARAAGRGIFGAAPIIEPADTPAADAALPALSTSN